MPSRAMDTFVLGEEIAVTADLKRTLLDAEECILNYDDLRLTWRGGLWLSFILEIKTAIKKFSSS